MNFILLCKILTEYPFWNYFSVYTAYVNYFLQEYLWFILLITCVEHQTNIYYIVLNKKKAFNYIYRTVFVTLTMFSVGTYAHAFTFTKGAQVFVSADLIIVIKKENKR